MKLNIRYLSDLHLEFIKPNKIEKFIKKIPSGIDEICILAGDIGNPYQSNYNMFMEFISKNFKKTFVISGNHEYYNKTKTIQETNTFLTEYFEKFDNISFLNNNYEKYENHCFIGTTLWSKITNPSYEINDVHNIPNFDYKQYNILNTNSVDFLKDSLQNNDNCIVITHHMPSSSLIDIKYKTEKMLPYNQWFYCDMDGLIETNKDKIKCWVYGHTHTPSYSIINGIPFLCNPIGYPNENNKIDFQKNIIIGVEM
jgi:predicted phosphohydrolase